MFNIYLFNNTPENCLGQSEEKKKKKDLEIQAEMG
jgi:hypothetical protein